MLFFIIAALLGALVLAISVFSGTGDGDHQGLEGGDGEGPGFLNLKSVSLFLMGMGIVGAIATYYMGGVVNFITSVIGVFGGVLFAGAGYQVLKLVYQQQATSLYSLQDLLGRQANVSIAIPKHGVGEVSCEISSQRIYREARSKSQKAIAVGEIVYIEDIEGGVLIVEPWTAIEASRS